MRRKLLEITDKDEINKIIDSTNIGNLATIGCDGYPYITPVNFVRVNDCIYFHCALKGEKLNNIAVNSKVCFEIDIPLGYLGMGWKPNHPICQLHQLSHCVIIRGRANIIGDDSLKASVMNALIEKHEPNSSFKHMTKDLPRLKACHIIEIKPDSISAKSDLLQDKGKEAAEAVLKYFTDRDLPEEKEAVKALTKSFAKFE